LNWLLLGLKLKRSVRIVLTRNEYAGGGFWEGRMISKAV